MTVLRGLPLVLGMLGLVAVGCSDEGDGSGATGTGGTGGTGGATYDPACVELWEWRNANCAPPAMNPIATCQDIKQLYTHGGCVAEDEALQSCMASHQAEWACEVATYCDDEMEAALTCLEPYCTQHPAEC